MSAREVLEVVLGLLVLVCLLATVAAPAVFVHKALRRRRDARLAHQWEWAVDACGPPWVNLAFVRRVYQYARQGSKADVVWYATGEVQDTWFWGWHAPAGVYVVLSGDAGWGPHNANPNVFYVQPAGVLSVVPGSAPRARQRHQRRTSPVARER